MYQCIKDPTIDKVSEIKSRHGIRSDANDVFYFLHKSDDRYETLFVSFLLTQIVDDVREALNGKNLAYHMDIELDDCRFVCRGNQPIYVLNTLKRQALQYASDKNAISINPSGTSLIDLVESSKLPYPEYWHRNVEPLLSFMISEKLYINHGGQWVESDYNTQN